MKKLLEKPWITTLTGVILVILILGAALLYMFRDELLESSYTFLGDQAFGELAMDESANEEALSSRAGGGSYPSSAMISSILSTVRLTSTSMTVSFRI